MGERKVEVMFLILPLLLSNGVSAQVAEQKGELRLYHRSLDSYTWADFALAFL